MIRDFVEKHPYLATCLVLCLVCAVCGFMLAFEGLQQGNMDVVGGGIALIAAPSIMTIVGIGIDRGMP